MRLRLVSVLAALALTACSQVMPGSSRTPTDVFSLQDAADFSKQIERELAERGAFVALVFRSGRSRDALPDGVRYTHGAFWVYTPIETEDGGTVYGYAVYNLYHGEEDVTASYLAQDWPLDFTRGDAVGEVGVIVPVPEMQRRILDVMASDNYEALHQPDYALLSNPDDLRYQNCNEFMLDIVASAAWETTDRARIKVNIAEYVNATPIPLNFWERLTASWFDPRVRLDDQGEAVQSTTFAAIRDFMAEYELDQESFELSSPYLPAENAEDAPAAEAS